MYPTYIIIVAFNGIQWLRKCLDSIDHNKYKVIVIDNNSSDKTVAIVKSNYPDVHLIINSKNLGFGKANNVGISYALKQGADRVFLLNQDAYLVEDSLDKLIKIQKTNSEFGILSPIHVNLDKSRLDKNFSNYVDYSKSPQFYSDHVLKKDLKTVYEVPFVNAAGWLVSKKCLMTVGGFDPIFFHYGEDNNYSQRAKFHGFKIGVLPNSYIIHDREDRITSPVALFSKEYYTNELRKFKVRCADVNNFDDQKIKAYKSKFKKQLIKAFVKMDKEKFLNLLAFLKQINKTIPLIESSVSQNKIARPNYLEL